MNSYAPDEQTTEIGILPANFCISHHVDWTNAVKSYIKEIGITGVRWMKCEVEQIDPKQEEHVMVYCHNREASWVQNVREAVFGQTSVCGYKNHVLYQLKLSDIFYVEQQRNQRRGQA